jgi:hypothetical protein
MKLACLVEGDENSSVLILQPIGLEPAVAARRICRSQRGHVQPLRDPGSGQHGNETCALSARQ